MRAKRQLVESACAGAGWEVPRLLEEMRKAPDLFFDTVASVYLKSFSQGRIALVGDAAYGGTLGGQGTPLALIGAYVLAGELVAARGGHRAAFEHYEATMRPYASKGQKGAKHVGASWRRPPGWASRRATSTCDCLRPAPSRDCSGASSTAPPRTSRCPTTHGRPGPAKCPRPGWRSDPISVRVRRQAASATKPETDPAQPAALPALPISRSRARPRPA